MTAEKISDQYTDVMLSSQDVPALCEEVERLRALFPDTGLCPECGVVTFDHCGVCDKCGRYMVSKSKGVMAATMTRFAKEATMIDLVAIGAWGVTDE